WVALPPHSLNSACPNPSARVERVNGGGELRRAHVVAQPSWLWGQRASCPLTWTSNARCRPKPWLDPGVVLSEIDRKETKGDEAGGFGRVPTASRQRLNSAKSFGSMR